MTPDDLNRSEFDAVVRMERLLERLEPDQRERIIRKLAAANGLQLKEHGPAIDLEWLLDLPELAFELRHATEPNGHGLN